MEPACLPPSIRFSDVSYVYPNTQFSANLSFELAAGKLTAFVGSSGSGKSTAIQLLLGLITPQRGTIWVNGETLESIGFARYWAQTSAVFQDSMQPMLPVCLTGLPACLWVVRPSCRQTVARVGRGSVSRSPAHLSASQTCLCSMNPPVHSTPVRLVRS
ncbi:MAG: ATP-binding cassette domain-containing protein [Betaproteobacteria bacterium]|nr:ATP-binding cassette domain-containing protein [Betaproteobacteria bacterium]